MPTFYVYINDVIDDYKVWGFYIPSVFTRCQVSAVTVEFSGYKMEPEQWEIKAQDIDDMEPKMLDDFIVTLQAAKELVEKKGKNLSFKILTLEEWIKISNPLYDELKKTKDLEHEAWFKPENKFCKHCGNSLMYHRRYTFNCPSHKVNQDTKVLKGWLETIFEDVKPKEKNGES